MTSETSLWWPITRRGALALGLAALPAGGVGRAAGEAGWGVLDRMAAAAVRARLAPGIQLCVTARGTPIYAKAFGAANLETGTAMEPSSVLRVGSLAKQFAAAAILLLAEDGALAIDDPLSRFIPEVPHAGEVTLRHLLTHTSGLGLSQPVPEAVSTAEHDSASLLAALLAARPALQHSPGARWIYNNFAYKLLGLVVERTSGLAYSEFFRTRLAARAGLARTAVDRDRQLVAGRASGYIHDAGSPLGFKLAEPASMSWHGAAGNVRSTALELCRWHHALLGGRLLRPASLEAMLTPARRNDPPSTDVSEWGPDAPPERKQYGLGLYIGIHESRRLVTHTGSTKGFLCRLTSYSDEEVSVAGIINVDRGTQGRASSHETALTAMLALAARIALGRAG